MSDKFRNKYRIPSARLQNWDYRWSGAYFITICTQNRERYFGEIENHGMKLSTIGIIADVCWHEIKNHARNIELGAFVVMPNHVHGILILNDHMDNGGYVQTLHATSLQSPFQPTSQQSTQPSSQPSHPTRQQTSQSTPQQTPDALIASISPKPDSVSTIIRSYKSAVTKHAPRLGFNFEWQTRFHDHIIRVKNSFDSIQTYIYQNPSKWVDDKFLNS